MRKRILRCENFQAKIKKNLKIKINEAKKKSWQLKKMKQKILTKKIKNDLEKRKNQNKKIGKTEKNERTILPTQKSRVQKKSRIRKQGENASEQIS